MRMFIAVAILLLPALAQGAELRRLGGTADIPDAILEPGRACTHRMAGQIAKGDLQKIIAQKIDGQSINIVCLDSPGGSLAEAIDIADYFKKNAVATKLEAGARCESACALIFMAGSYPFLESGIGHWRVMHPNAKLGFHAPALLVKDGNYTNEAVTKAYNVALQSVSETIFKLIVKAQNYQGGNSMKISLLGEMLKTPSDQMLYVDTVDEAGRWDITVWPIREDPRLSKELIYDACVRAKIWKNGLSMLDLDPNYYIFDSVMVFQEASSAADEYETIVAITNEMAEEGCKFRVKKRGRKASDVAIYAEFNYEGGFSVDRLLFLDPATRLERLD